MMAAGCNTPSQNSTAYQNQSQGAHAFQTNQQATTPVPSTVPPVPVVFDTTLSGGSLGTAVANVQQFLADEKLYTGLDTGIFDKATTDAVIAFQEQENLTPANGIFGSAEQNRANVIIGGHPDWVTTLSDNNEYKNVNGGLVHSPANSTNGIPAGATAICGDGTYSFSMHRSGTCSHHGGVAEWLSN